MASDPTPLQTPPTQLQVPRPNLANTIDARIMAALLATNCHEIGVIQTFDGTSQTATVTIALQQNIPKQDPSSAKTDPTGQPFIYVATAYPVLVNVPVLFIGGGNCSLTFPIAPGDEGLLCFNDRNFDSWFSTGTTATPPNTARYHDLSDGLFIPGFRSTPHFLPNFSGTDAVLQNLALGGQLSLGTKVSLKNNATSLLAVLNALNSAIVGLGGTNNSALIASLLK